MANKSITFGQNTTTGVDFTVNGKTICNDEIDIKDEIVLSLASGSKNCGTSLPASGINGQLFFKIVG